MKRIIAMALALGVAFLGLFFVGQSAATASVPGDSPQNPIVVASPSEVPSDAVEDDVSTYNTPAECDTTRSWVLTVHHDAVTHEETTTVVDEPAYDETIVDAPAVPAQHYSLKGNSEIGKYDVPVFPADYWQANAKKEPHLNNPNITWIEGYGHGLHYASHGSKGNRDWFYFQPAVPEQTHVVHHDAVTHEETITVVDHEAYDEVTYYAWSDGAECPVVTPDVATATVVTTPPTCSEDGTASIVTVNSHVLSDTIVGTPGEHKAVVEADTGALFEQGPGVSEDGKFMTISYTVPAATGDCPKPPTNNPPSDNPPHNNVPPNDNPPSPFRHLPNAGLDDTSAGWTLPLGIVLLLAGLGIAVSALWKRRA